LVSAQLRERALREAGISPSEELLPVPSQTCIAIRWGPTRHPLGQATLSCPRATSTRRSSRSTGERSPRARPSWRPAGKLWLPGQQCRWQQHRTLRRLVPLRRNASGCDQFRGASGGRCPNLHRRSRAYEVQTTLYTFAGERLTSLARLKPGSP
jgi:hypothetical protein